jgi:two-component system, NtrC family, response regulator
MSEKVMSGLRNNISISSGNILLIEDEDKVRSLLNRIVSMEGYVVYEAPDLRTAEKILRKEDIDVILSDVRLPDGSGLDFIRKVKKSCPEVEIVLLTAHAAISDGVEAIRSGAFDYISKGIDNDRLLPLIAGAMDKTLLQKRAGKMEEKIVHEFGFERIIGQSPLLRDTVSMARKVTLCDTAVLLLGETGTGKELFARAIHTHGRRAGYPFVAINCSTLSRNILESELFGHKAGAFTGATRDKRGLIEEAHGGSLFLDEIGEMHLDLQAKLLRVLETQQFFKVGSVAPSEANIRIISATNRNLQADVMEGKFREDLFYRLNVFTIEIPSLRARSKDIPLLAEYFINHFCCKLGKHIEGISKEFIKLLERQPWKGNIRELRNVLERALILTEGYELLPESLPLEFQTGHMDLCPNTALELATIEKLHIERVLKHTKGNKVEAARLLNIGLSTVYRKMGEYGLI